MNRTEKIDENNARVRRNWRTIHFRRPSVLHGLQEVASADVCIHVRAYTMLHHHIADGIFKRLFFFTLYTFFLKLIDFYT